MNAGTYRAGAVAFRLDVLSKLSAIKPSNEGAALTLLHFVAEVLRKALVSHPDLSRDARHEKALDALSSASGLGVAEVVAEVESLRRSLDAIGDEYPRHRKPFGGKDCFSLRMREFHELAKRRMGELSAQLGAMQAALKKVGAHLTGEPGATEGEVHF
ncbi:Formin, FH2 domain-containing protein [Pavlovales sp. CCMP2436]|nr:Formin, FH2 domain-containing protein [Pavlovales sp. CCMP2436]